MSGVLTGDPGKREHAVTRADQGLAAAAGTVWGRILAGVTWLPRPGNGKLRARLSDSPSGMCKFWAWQGEFLRKV